MSTIQLKMISTGLFFLFIFLSGFWLSHSGKPLNGVVLTVHKLIALGAVVFLVVTAHRLQQAAPLSTIQIAAIGITVVCFVVTIITGGLVSIDKPMPAAVSLVHQLFPYLTILSNAAALFLLPLSGRG